MINMYVLSTGVTSMLSFLLGLFVFFHNRKRQLNRKWFFLSLSISFWCFGYFLTLTGFFNHNLSLLFSRASHACGAFIPILFFDFVVILLEKRKSYLKLLQYGYGCSIVIFLLCLTPFIVRDVMPKLGIKYYPEWGVLYPIYVALYLIFACYGNYILFKALIKAKGARKNQLKYFFVGTALGFAGGISLFFLILNIRIPPFASVFIGIYPIVTSYAIIRHQLMEIEVIIKKTLVFAGLFVASYAVFASFAYLGSMLFENVVRNRWIALVPSVFVIVLILRPLENFLRNATDKYLFQKKYDYRQLLRTFSDEVLTVLDLSMLVDITVNKLAEIMKLENATIMLYDDSKEEFRVGASSMREFPQYAFKENDSFIRGLQRNSNQYILKNAPGKRLKSKTTLDEKLDELHAALIIPLMHRKNMVGILSLGQKKSDEEFVQEDIDILLPLSKTLAIAISNAQLIEKLSQAQAQAAQREKMAVIGTLSAGINHEICNPLGIARGQCEMFLLNLTEGLYKDKSSEELLDKAKTIMEKVMHETDRATIITRKLSSFAKPAKGQITDDVNVEKELDEVITLVEHDLKLDNIHMKKNIQEGLPSISADSKQLQEILFNIIRNAAQSIQGEGEVAIHASGNAGKVYIDIADTGTGISKSNLTQIFNPFFTTKEPGSGTGLGLFIVKQIVERNNGHISVRSELGKGTTFRLTFNAAEPSKEKALGDKGGIT